MPSRARVLVPLYPWDRYRVLPWAEVTVYEADGRTLFQGELYRSAEGSETFANPHTVSPGIVRFYLDRPRRFRIGYRTGTDKQEQYTAPQEPFFDADEVAATEYPFWVVGELEPSGLLRAETTTEGHWSPPGLSPHTHKGHLDTAVRVGGRGPLSARVSSAPESTAVGMLLLGRIADVHYLYIRDKLPVGTSIDFTGASMLGHGAIAGGRYGISFGVDSRSADGPPTAEVQNTIALGQSARAYQGTLVIGRQAYSDVTTGVEHELIAIGRLASGSDSQGVSIGTYAAAGHDSVALGFDTGKYQAQAITVGAGANAAEPDQIVLGRREQAPIGTVLATPVGQRWTVPSNLHVAGDVVLDNQRLGFYGNRPTHQPIVGRAEVGSGVPALDSLVLALRELGILQRRNPAVSHYDVLDLVAELGDLGEVHSWTNRRAETELATDTNGAMLRWQRADRHKRPYVEVSASTRLVETDSSPQVSTYLVVAGRTSRARTGENLLSLQVDDPRNQVLVASTASGTTANSWRPTMSTYWLDGLDQTSNRSIGRDGAHVYGATLDGGWPQAPLVIGNPEGIDPGWDGWFSEIVGLDATWDDENITDIADGLQFRHGIDQNPARFQEPGMNTLIRAQEPDEGIYLYLEHRFALALPYPLAGSVSDAPNGARVRIWTVSEAGQTLEATVPVQYDGTFFAILRSHGWVRAHVIDEDDQRIDMPRILPPERIGGSHASIGEASLATLALLRQGPRAHFRAELILAQLSQLQQADGSLTDTVDLPGHTPSGSIDSGIIARVGNAALRYAEVTGAQYFRDLAEDCAGFLTTRLLSPQILSSFGGDLSFTTDVIHAHWLFRALGWSQAEDLATALTTQYWSEAIRRPVYSLRLTDTETRASDYHDIWTDLWASWCYETIGDRDKTRFSRAAIGAFRLRSSQQVLGDRETLYPSPSLYPGATVYPDTSSES